MFLGNLTKTRIFVYFLQRLPTQSTERILTCAMKQQWEISSFSNKLYKFHSSDFDKYLVDRTNNTRKIKLEVLLFNLIFPSHNGIPQSAIDLFKPDRDNRRCELSDNNQFELDVEKELVKCGRTVFVDEHRKVLHEYDYLNQQYAKIKFFSSEQIWPHKRFWLFRADDEPPILLEGVKTLLSSGIYLQTLSYFETFKYYKRSRSSQARKSTEPEKQTMDGKFKSLFEVFLFVTLVWFWFFLLEKGYNVGQKYCGFYRFKRSFFNIRSGVNFKVNFEGIVRFSRKKYKRFIIQLHLMVCLVRHIIFRVLVFYVTTALRTATRYRFLVS